MESATAPLREEIDTLRAKLAAAEEHAALYRAKIAELHVALRTAHPGDHDKKGTICLLCLALASSVSDAAARQQAMEECVAVLRALVIEFSDMPEGFRVIGTADLAGADTALAKLDALKDWP